MWYVAMSAAAATAAVVQRGCGDHATLPSSLLLLLLVRCHRCHNSRGENLCFQCSFATIQAIDHMTVAAAAAIMRRKLVVRGPRVTPRYNFWRKKGRGACQDAQ